MRHRGAVPLAVLVVLTLAATADAGLLLPCTSRTTFEALGPIVERYGFEDLSGGATGIQNIQDPFTAGGVTYNALNTIVTPGSFPDPLSNVLANGPAGALRGTIASAPQYTMLGLDLSWVWNSSTINLTVFTNAQPYSLMGLPVPSAAVGSSFYGFAAPEGEYFTGFHVSAPSGNGAIDNVTLGAPLQPGAPVPEPATVLLLGAGLLGLGASRRRRL